LGFALPCLSYQDGKGAAKTMAKIPHQPAAGLVLPFATRSTLERAMRIFCLVIALFVFASEAFAAEILGPMPLPPNMIDALNKGEEQRREAERAELENQLAREKLEQQRSDEREARQKQWLAEQTARQTARELGDAEAWCAERLTDSSIEPLAGKLPLASFAEITAQMLSIETRPTVSDVRAIRALSNIQIECRAKMVAAMGQAPQMVARYEALNFKTDLVVAKLLNRKISFGDANRLLKEAYLDSLN